MLAIITHKGAAADAGHYIGFVKKSVFHGRASEGAIGGLEDDDEDWYKFDDDKVSVFPAEKVATLDGGGQFTLFHFLVPFFDNYTQQARTRQRMFCCTRVNLYEH